MSTEVMGSLWFFPLNFPPLQLASYAFALQVRLILAASPMTIIFTMYRIPSRLFRAVEASDFEGLTG